jgi:hypothetical protein
MLNHADRIDCMPTSRANRAMAKAEYAAAEAVAERIVRALAWAASLVRSPGASMTYRQPLAH